MNNIKEQEICLRCGLCCDGTLFSRAHLEPGERGHLPELMEQNSYSEGEKDFFRLPCLYFSGRCIIYKQKKAKVCSLYRCKVLREFAEGRMTQGEAFKIVKEAGLSRDRLFEDYMEITGEKRPAAFRELLAGMGRLIKRPGEDNPGNREADMFIARCNIFEALLIRHFRPASEFDAMIE